MTSIQKHFTSDISKKEFPISEQVYGSSLSGGLFALISQDHPGFSTSGKLAISELASFREKYIYNKLTNQIGELSELEKTVLDRLKDHETISDLPDGRPLSFGQRVADKVAEFGGSWTFIISFGVFLVLWIILNAFWLANTGFDPYPFILLNLILSCIAAMQAPIIMMSQNRQEEKDRERSKEDYMVNLKSEIEIRMLHEKLDHLIMHQQQHLIDIQQVQIDMMNNILKELEKK